MSFFTRFNTIEKFQLLTEVYISIVPWKVFQTIADRILTSSKVVRKEYLKMS